MDPAASTPIVLPARYELLRLLGEGGFGAVHAARDRELGCMVAVKVLRRVEKEVLLRRFEREARLLARLEHPNVLRVFDHGVGEGGTPYLVTELLDGRSLGEHRPEDPFEVMWGVAEGLQAVHDAGLVHRDLKPANVLVTGAGRPVILDFGLATSEEVETLTATGQVVGTPRYLAPELVRGGDATAASDWYAWGATLYEVASGRPAFDLEDLHRSLRNEPRPLPDLAELGLPAAAGEVLRACLDEDPDRRPQDLDGIRHLLEEPAAGAGTMVLAPLPPSRRGGRGLLAELAVLVAAFLAVYLPGGPAPPPAAPPPPAPAPAPRSSTFSPEILEHLAAEVARAREDPGRVAGLDPRRDGSLAGLLARRGAGVLDDLVGERAVLAWMRDGGDPRDLPAEDRRVLVAHDRDLEAIGFPPTFRPFLEVAPAGPGWVLPADIPRDERWPRLPRLSPGEPGYGWLAVAVEEFARAFAARLDLEDALAAGELEGSEVATMAAEVFFESDSRQLQGYAVANAATPEGRERLRARFAPGLRHLRRFLVAAARALRGAGTAGVARRAQLLKAYFWKIDDFLYLGMFSGVPARLTGAAPTSAAGSYLDAIVRRAAAFKAQHLGFLEDRGVADALRRAMEHAARERAAGLETELWYLLVEYLVTAGDLAAAREVHDARAARLAPGLNPRQREEVARWRARAAG